MGTVATWRLSTIDPQEPGMNDQRVRNFLLQSGGIRLPASKRSDRRLSMADRQEISVVGRRPLSRRHH